MIFPSILEYREALRFEGALKSHRQLKLMTDESGEPCFSSGKFAVVFRMYEEYTGKEFAVKCFIRDQERRQKSYEFISENLNKFCSPYLVHFEYLPNEVRVNSRIAGDDKYPVVITKWVECKTFGQKLTELCGNADKPGIFLLACAFDRMALWLMEQPFSHGDLNTENILVEPDGTLKLIDYDGMFTPEMAGELARENGSSGFQHPLRSIDNFGTHIDDFSILLISLSLHVLTETPSLYDQHNFGGSILFDETELLKPGSGKIWEAIESVRFNNEISQRLVMMYMAVANPAEMQLFGIKSILNDAAAKAPEPSIKTSFKDELPELIPYRKGDKWGFCDKNKKIVAKCKYDRVDFYQDNFIVALNGKFGIVNKAGQEIDGCKYDDLYDFNEGFARVMLSKKYGFIDITGKKVISLKYEMANDFSEGLAAVEQSGKWGYIDMEGKEIVATKYNSVSYFSEGLAAVQQYDGWGYIDKEGKEIIECKYFTADNFDEGLAKVEKYGKWGILDKTGNEVLVCKYDEIGYFSEGLAVVKCNMKYGFIDKTGEEIIPCKFDWASNFKEGLAEVRIERIFGFIDMAGNLIISGLFDDINSFNGGLAKIKTNGKWGFIDKIGKKIVECKYDEVSEIIEGFIQVRLNEKWGYIDNTGKKIIACKYEKIQWFYQGLAQVKQNGKWGVISSNGNIVIEFQYEKIGCFYDNLAYFKLGKKWGYFNKNGKKIIECKYDDAGSFNEGLAKVSLSDKEGYIDKKGTEYWENYESELLADYLTISVADPSFAGRRKGENCDYIMMRNRSGNLIKVELDKGCPPCTSRFHIKQLHAIEDLGEVKKGEVFLKAYGIVEEEE